MWAQKMSDKTPKGEPQAANVARLWAAHSSHWDDHPDHPVEDWQYEVANGDTRQSYKDWVISQAEQEDENEPGGP